MAPRAYWKGYLKLSLVSCPIALYPATSEREKISFHQINRNTGHRIKYGSRPPTDSAPGDAKVCLSTSMTVADYSAAPLTRKKRLSGRGKPRLSRSVLPS